jgi:hypothetical protein
MILLERQEGCTEWFVAGRIGAAVIGSQRQRLKSLDLLRSPLCNGRTIFEGHFEERASSAAVFVLRSLRQRTSGAE